MATVNFLYRSTKQNAPLHLRLLYRLNSIDYVFGVNTKIEVSKDYWTKRHNQKRPNVDLENEQIAVGLKLKSISDYIRNAFNSVPPEIVNKEWLQNVVNDYYDPKLKGKGIPLNLVDYIDYYKDIRRNDLNPAVVKRCDVLKNKLLSYERAHKTTILIENINDDFRNSFIDFERQNKYASSTFNRELIFIKTLCTHAKSKGLKVSLELDRFSKEFKEKNNINLATDSEKKNFIYLNHDDIDKLENLPQNKLSPILTNAKNLLLISCYTGQRISDFMRFNNSMVKSKDDKKYIEFTQVKTSTKIALPLHSKIINLLSNNNGQWPEPIPDAKYNKYIKTVCRIAKIDDIVKGGKIANLGTKEYPIWRKETKQYKKYLLVSSHIGRRSFATNNFHSMPASILKKFTGHKTEKMLLTYISEEPKDELEIMFKYIK
jgi:hypothetical protein